MKQFEVSQLRAGNFKEEPIYVWMKPINEGKFPIGFFNWHVSQIVIEDLIKQKQEGVDRV